METPYPYHRPKQVGADAKEVGALPFVAVSVLLAALGVASSVVLVWAVEYWMKNTPVFGRPAVPPAISPGVSSAVIFASLFLTGLFLFFSIASARESVRRWGR